MYKNTGQKEVVIKRSDNQISTNAKVGNIAGDNVQCFNRFSVLTDLEVTWGSTNTRLVQARTRGEGGKSTRSRDYGSTSTIFHLENCTSQKISAGVDEQIPLECIVNDQVACLPMAVTESISQQKLS